MLPVIEELSDLTADCAPASEHGAVAVQAVPEPEGEAYRVAIVAALAEVAGMASAAAIPRSRTAAAPMAAAGRDVAQGFMVPLQRHRDAAPAGIVPPVAVALPVVLVLLVLP